MGEEAGTLLPGAECDFWACALCVCTNVPAWLSQQNRGSLWLACFIERPEVGSPEKACQRTGGGFSEAAFPHSPRCLQVALLEEEMERLGVGWGGTEAVRAGTGAEQLSHAGSGSCRT